MHVNISPSTLLQNMVLVSLNYKHLKLSSDTMYACQCESPYPNKTQFWLIRCYNKWLILKPVSYFPHKWTPYEHFTARGAHSLAHASVYFHMLTLTLMYKVPWKGCDSKTNFTGSKLNPLRDYSTIVCKSTKRHKRGICWNISIRSLAYAALWYINLFDI